MDLFTVIRSRFCDAPTLAEVGAKVGASVRSRHVVAAAALD